jgi:hypothetical protein
MVTSPVFGEFLRRTLGQNGSTIPHRFMADVDAALMQQVLDVSERKGKANVQHYRQANDLRAAVKVLERVAFCHA